jgi:hypothetical protein
MHGGGRGLAGRGPHGPQSGHRARSGHRPCLIPERAGWAVLAMDPQIRQLRPGLPHPQRGLCGGPRAIAPAVGHLEFSRMCGHVAAHRLLGDEQAVGDLPVGETLGQEFGYLRSRAVRPVDVPGCRSHEAWQDLVLVSRPSGWSGGAGVGTRRSLGVEGQRGWAWPNLRWPAHPP